MADDSAAQKRNGLPARGPRFQVLWDARPMAFDAVSGLDGAFQEIEYRHGESGIFSTVNMPGIIKHGSVTMTRGILKADGRALEWLQQFKLNTGKRMPITVTLLDEVDQPVRAWTLANAWPAKITGAALTADGGEVTLESIELVHEGISDANA